MPTDLRDPTVAKAPIQLNLTAAGWTVVALMVASVLLASSSRIAVGFLIPLAVALVVDVYSSWLFLSRQTLSVIASRTTAYRPEGIPIRLLSSGGSTGVRPVRVTLSYPDGTDCSAGVHDEPVTVELHRPESGVTDFLRAQVYCTILGLGYAQQWQTHGVPTLHWAPTPDREPIAKPEAMDEVARLRTYEPGDRLSRVSWPVTARTGTMHVRTAGLGQEEMIVVVNAVEPDEVEPAVQQATTLLSQLLEDGHSIRVVTRELTEGDRLSLRAEALVRPEVEPERAASPRHYSIVERFLTDEDDLAKRMALVEPGPAIAWPYGVWINVSRDNIETVQT